MPRSPSARRSSAAWSSSTARPDRVMWSPTGVNVPDYPKLAQLWWQQIGDVNSGAFTPQQAMDRLAGEMDQVMARMQEADEKAKVYGGCGPRLNKEVDPKEWLGKPDGPKAKLANEKPKGVTIPYDELVKRWTAAEVVLTHATGQGRAAPLSFVSRHHARNSRTCRCASAPTSHPPDHAATRTERLQHPARRDAGRQDDADAADGRAGQADAAARSGSTARTSPASRCRSATSRWSTSSSSTTRTSASSTTSPRRCASAACRAAEIKAASAASPSCCSSRRCSTAGRASCPAASSSAPRWRARWSRTPTWSCSTSRWPTSTTSCARSCATSCRGCLPTAACMVVYATTEPTEALLLGGQHGDHARGTRHAVRRDVATVYREPADLTSARVFSDPPINTAQVDQAGRADRAR